MIAIECLKRAFRPLASRKVRVALATVLAAYAAEYGLGVSEEMVFTVLGVGVALILGIAHEDAGKNDSAELKVLTSASSPRHARGLSLSKAVESSAEEGTVTDNGRGV